MVSVTFLSDEKGAILTGKTDDPVNVPDFGFTEEDDIAFAGRATLGILFDQNPVADGKGGKHAAGGNAEADSVALPEALLPKVVRLFGS
jgi:hypothetical protein